MHWELPASLVETARSWSARSVAANLRREGLAGLASCLGAARSGEAAAWMAQSLVFEQELERLVTALNEAGVRFLLLKGAALRRWLYPEPAMRVMSDIDLLVPESTHAAATAVMEALGYRPGLSAGGSVVFTEQQYLKRVGALAVPLDLHWRLSTNPVLRQRFEFDELWHARRRLAPGLHGLGPVHALLHAAVHRAAMEPQRRDRLIWLLDLHLLWTRLTPAQQDRCVGIARERQLAALLYDGLTVLRHRFGTEVAPDLRAALDEAAVNEPTARLLYLQPGLRRLWMEIGFLPSRRDRLRYLWQMAFPARDYMQRRYGRAGIGSYLRRAAGGVKRLMRR